MNYKDSVKDLKITCNHMASCLPKTKFIETKKGGLFVYGKRKIGVYVDPFVNRKYEESFKIRKLKYGFGLRVHPLLTAAYPAMKKSVKKGLGIRD